MVASSDLPAFEWPRFAAARNVSFGNIRLSRLNVGFRPWGLGSGERPLSPIRVTKADSLLPAPFRSFLPC